MLDKKAVKHVVSLKRNSGTGIFYISLEEIRKTYNSQIVWFSLGLVSALPSITFSEFLLGVIFVDATLYS